MVFLEFDLVLGSAELIVLKPCVTTILYNSENQYPTKYPTKIKSHL